MKVAIVGATGLVGGQMLQVLKERNFPVSELIPVASARSAGKKLVFNEKEKMSFEFYIGAIIILSTVILNGIVKYYKK